MENYLKNNCALKPTEIEVEAGSLEEAVDKALKILSASRDRVRIKILSEEKKGLFGMKGAKGAKIRATVICSKKYPEKH